MSSFARTAITAWLVLAAAACAKTTDDDNLGTNTNWLRTCVQQAECEDGQACLCGVCTKACDESTECGAVNAETTCEPLNPAACHMSASGSACLQACDENSDCTALDDGRCVAGLCVPMPAEAPEDASTQMPMPDSSTPSTDPFDLTRNGGFIQVTDAYTACESHSDCTLVGTVCDGCCERAAIADSLSTLYMQHKDEACAGYQGAICDCSFIDELPRCVDSRCKAVPREELPCFAPGVDDDHAYDDGAIGCACDQRDQSICTEFAALVCSYESSDNLAWIAVEDGPCGEPTPDPSCSSGTLVPSAEACLADYFRCYRVADGQYCGTNPDP